jgi:ABC-type glycerol-3-phosphate transport system substrate-binding protein
VAQLTKDGRVFGYPLTIQPAIMWYDTARFEEAGVPGPQGGWMVDQFRDALEQLDPTLNDDIAPFKPQDYGNHYLLLLMASYGGIPYDRSTDPPTINFDDQVALDAARQVLDLAREGYIDYQPLGESSGVSYGGPQESPVIADRLTFWNWRLQDRDENPQMEDFLLTVYPRGSQYIPASYDVSAAYIHPESRSPEACYRFISELAQTPDLFIGMPPRRSLIDDPSIADWLGEDALVLYQDYAEVLEAPNILVLPQGSASAGAWIEETWVNQAFDAYVVDNVELETAFEEARENILTYRECIEPYKDQDTTDFEEQEEWMAFTRQFTDCAITIDPDLREQFLFYYQDEDE